MTSAGQGDGAGQEPLAPVTDPAQAVPAPRKRFALRKRPNPPRRHGSGLLGRLIFLAVVFGLAALTLQLLGRTLPMPVWVVAEVEARLNRSLADGLPGSALSLGGIELTVGEDWVPHIVLDDLRLLQAGGQTLLALPETFLNLDPSGLPQGQLRAKSLRIVGAHIDLRRDGQGNLLMALGSGEGPQIDNLATAFASLDRAFALPALAHLTQVQIEGLSLTLTDQRTGRIWQVGDGRVTLDNREAEIAAQMSLSLVAGGTATTRALLTAVAAKGAGSARVSVQVENVAAKDLAAQTPVLGWLGVLDAPISGRLAATLDRQGVSAVEGRLDIGAGALQPAPNATPIAFDRASLGLGYDPSAGRIVLSDLSVQSRTLRVATKGQVYLVDAAGQKITGALSGRIPAAFLGQIQISDLSVDPAGLFAAPVAFHQGAVDVRLKLDPFTLDIGQLSLSEGGEHLGLSGQISADPAGWRVALDLTLNQISRDRLLALWPLRLVTGTRNWVESNIRNADLSGLRASVRLAPGAETKTELSYGFSQAELRIMPKMPPVTGADGYATIQGKTYTLVMSKGSVTPPEGGVLDVAGTVFAVPDITLKPAVANIDLHMAGALTAVLSLMDQPPFNYLQKAGQPVDLGQGQASLSAQVSFPMKGRVMPWDVSFEIAAKVTDFASDVLIKGHHLTSPLLTVVATPNGLTISGKGLIGQVPFDGRFVQDLPDNGPNPQEQALQDGLTEGIYIAVAPRPVPPAQVTGQVTLSQAAVAEFALGLPERMISGAAQADVTLDLPKGAAPLLALRSDLAGMTLALPDLRWVKPSNESGRLEADIRLGAAPEVTRLNISGAGLNAKGKVLLHADGKLNVARFDAVTLAPWLEGSFEITAQGDGQPVALAMTAGTIDLQNFPQTSASVPDVTTNAGNPIQISAQSVKLADSLRITGFEGSFSTQGGFNGAFSGALNDAAPITGIAVPSRNGTAVRIKSDDAGLAMKAAGVFSAAQGGSLSMTLIPRAEAGTYEGSAAIKDIRVNNGSVMVDLLSAISVVGLLDQLRGAGIVFDTTYSQFVITPKTIEVQRGSAIGTSMGVSFEGLYHSDTDRLDMRGVVSPIYVLNGLGSILTKRGEGLFGFAYTLQGPAKTAEVSVNPLSILTPGMVRDLFRAPAPSLDLPASPAQSGGG